MKFLTFIFAIYIFALNIAPCEDTSVLDNEVKTEVSQAMNNDHRHNSSELCSPFCNCHCCHIHATYFKIVDFTVSTTDISTEVFYHFNGIEKDFKPTILQSPRV
tara:strand:+ start:6748 stop:7059 length:312 start_codon:yes stop_codon:yes gene_type:complete